MRIQRVLIANRGEIARRLIRMLAAHDIESVTVFSEPEVEQPWVDEADYAVYLNGATLADTYMNGRKLISSALDAAADAIHPGYCFLAERPTSSRWPAAPTCRSSAPTRRSCAGS